MIITSGKTVDLKQTHSATELFKLIEQNHQALMGSRPADPLLDATREELKNNIAGLSQVMPFIPLEVLAASAVCTLESLTYQMSLLGILGVQLDWRAVFKAHGLLP